MKKYSKTILLVALAALLAGYTIECLTPVSADSSAMNCCGNMPCSPANQNHDCCKNMPQPALALLSVNSSVGIHQSVLQAPGYLAVLAHLLLERHESVFCLRNTGERVHAPPGTSSLTASILRI